MRNLHSLLSIEDNAPGATEEVNTNDPTAPAISVSFGWEFYDWHEDEIAPGQTRPTGNDNNFNSRIVLPLAAGTLGSPWPIINRFSFANVEAPGGFGQYYEDELINISGNRWVVRPQIGVVHSRGPWSFELTGSALLFTDNKNFVDNARLEQRTLYTAQAHVIYDFKPGLWASISTGYGVKGRVYLEGEKTAFEVDNWLWAASFGFPIGKSQSVKLTWFSGRTQNDVGRDSDNLLLAWSIRWAN